MRLVLLLALSLVSASACAQTTWHNLHFGQSRDDVRAQLSAQNMPVETSQEGTLQSTTDFELALPGLRYPLPMLASFHFNDAAQLSDVTLTLDLAGMHRWAYLGSEDTILAFATEHLTSAISGRYGTPIYRSPSCDADPKTSPSLCLFSWHGNEQTIEMERHHSSGQAPRLLIRYQPLATDI